MSELFKHWVNGEEVDASDVLDIQNRIRNTTQLGACILLNALSFQSADNPLAIAPGTGRTVTLAGTGQGIILGGLWIDYLPEVTLTFGANTSGSQRNDLIVGQYAEVDLNPYTRQVRASGVDTATTVYEQGDGLALEIVVGTPGAGDPAIPGGWYAIARVRIASGETQIETTDIDILLPTGPDLLASEVSGGVTSVNGKMGAVTIVSRTPSQLDVDGVSGQVGLTIQNVVDSINGAVGPIVLTSSSLAFSEVDDAFTGEIEIKPSAFTSPDGSITVGGTDGAVTLEVSQQTRTYSRSGTTNSEGLVAFTVPFQILGAAGNITAGYNNTTNYHLYLLNQVIGSDPVSDFPAGLVYFQAYSASGAPLAGVGVCAIITTNVTPAT